MSERPTTTDGPGRAVNTRRTGSSRPPIDERVDLAARPCGADARADLEHVGAEHLRARGAEVVRVVLHERRAAVEADRHRLDDADERGGLPVALAPEAVAVGHEPLRRDARELAQRAEVLERVGERAEAALLEERAQAELDARRLHERVAPLRRRLAAPRPSRSVSSYSAQRRSAAPSSTSAMRRASSPIP